MPISAQQWRVTTGSLNAGKGTLRAQPSFNPSSGSPLFHLLPPPPSSWKGYWTAMVLLCTPLLYKMYILCVGIMVSGGTRGMRTSACPSTIAELTADVSTPFMNQPQGGGALLFLTLNVLLYVAMAIAVVLLNEYVQKERQESVGADSADTSSGFVVVEEWADYEVIFDPNTCSLYATLSVDLHSETAVLKCVQMTCDSVERDRRTILGHMVSFFLQLSTLVVLAMLLLLAGDVERNPGPIHGLDLTTLTRELSPAKDKWHEMGVQLEIELSHLSDIEDMYPTSERRLTEMLAFWLDGNTKASICWDSILKCLRSPTVHKRGLAEELQQKYCQVKKETAFSDGDSNNTSPPPSKPRAPNSDRVVPSTSIQRFAMYLKGVYSRAITTSGKFPHLMCNHFINLALVKKQQVSRSEADDFTKATLHGHIDEILKKKEPIKLEEMLNPVQGQPDMKCIFLEGAPGIGKSTCVGELCRRWEEIDALKKYSLVVLLRLREKRVQEAQSVEDLCFHRNRELRQAVAAEIEDCEGRDVLFILDGFDELPESLRKQSMFVELVQGTYLSHCTVLVTSRPSATADLLAVAQPQIHKQIEVIGFTQECIEQYARAFFDSNDFSSDFLTYLSTHPPIRSMMYIPLNCAIAVEIYKHNKTANRPIPQTMTQLYVEMSVTLLKRHLGEDDPLAKHLPEKLEDLPPQLLKPFTSLAKLAFEGLVRNEVVFHKLPVDLIHFGFMNSPTELYLGERALISHSFLHLTLQEFLTSFYISQLSPSEQKSVFEEHCFTPGWDVVWRFVAGLSGFHGIGWEVVQSRRGRGWKGGVNPFLIQCLYESQEKVDCDSVLGESEVEFSGWNLSLTSFDCYAIGWCVVNSRCMWRLDMSENSSLGGMLVDMLEHGLRFNCKGLHVPPQRDHPNLLTLDLFQCSLNSTAFNQLADVIPLMVNLRELYISDNPAGDGGLVKLLHSLSHLKRLQTLYMYDTNIGYSDIEALPLPSLVSLRELAIGESDDMSPECKELMFKKVLSPSSLEYVESVEVNWTDQAATLLEGNNNLIRLMQRYNSANLSSIPLIAKALHKNSHLKNLELATFDSFSDDIVSSLADMLRCNCSLENVELNAFIIEDIINEHQLSTLNNALQSNHTLKQLIVTSKNTPCLQNDKLDPRINLNNFNQ